MPPSGHQHWSGLGQRSVVAEVINSCWSDTWAWHIQTLQGNRYHLQGLEDRLPGREETGWSCEWGLGSGAEMKRVDGDEETVCLPLHRDMVDAGGLMCSCPLWGSPTS